MRKPRQRQEGMSHSISCTDEEWEKIREGAARADKGASAWFTACALKVNPLSAKTFPLVLDETEQLNMVTAITRLAHGLPGSPESLSDLGDNVRHVLRARLRAMTHQGRSAEARAKLREVFGEERAQRIEAWALMPRKS